MHQTFYIDIDEEITSIVDRIRKAKAEEVIIVVPKRALLIQSIVNLKLLKKEADSLKKQIMIVTQDKLGKMLIEKAGILVQQKLDEGLEEVMAFEDEKKEAEEEKKSQKTRAKKNNQSKIIEIGSAEYFSENSREKDDLIVEAEKQSEKDFESITNKELVTNISKEIRSGVKMFKKKNRSSLDMIRNVDAASEEYSFDGSALNDDEIETVSPKKSPEIISGRMIPKEKGVDRLEEFFSKNKLAQESVAKEWGNQIKKTKKKRNEFEDYGKVSVSGKFKRGFLFFGGLVILVALFMGAYIFLPKASVKIYAKIQSGETDVEINAKTNISEIDYVGKIIPARQVSAEAEISETFPSSGSKSVSNQKAKGKIIIYNEYTSSDQPLVATTRFLSENGKIFRLLSGVTVPGMKGNEPGTIEAEVVADEAGEDFNIEPTTFTIPGFKSSGAEKYAKFYAKSTEAMKSGGAGNEEMKVVAQKDIDTAKSQLLEKAKTEAKKELEKLIGDGAILPDEAIFFDEAQYESSVTVDELADRFSLKVKLSVKALVVEKKNVISLIGRNISQGEDKGNLSENSVELEFGKTDVDFNNGTMIIRIHATYNTAESIDLDNLKRGILGKDEEQLKVYLKSYSEIEKASVEYWPPFITGKIPIYESRVSISLDNLN